MTVGFCKRCLENHWETDLCCTDTQSIRASTCTFLSQLVLKTRVPLQLVSVQPLIVPCPAGPGCPGVILVYTGVYWCDTGVYCYDPGVILMYTDVILV